MQPPPRFPLDYQFMKWFDGLSMPRSLKGRGKIFYMTLEDNVINYPFFQEEEPDIVDILEEKMMWDRDAIKAVLLFFYIIGTFKTVKMHPGYFGYETRWAFTYEMDDFSSYSKDYEERPEFYEDILAGRLTLEDLQEANRVVRRH
ncbi:hypothetical protein [Desulfosediminicola ganghwensis]|uniref:hypothetical protein n=1 Tax=Desulfosediminicola ganghwensis TaxID=2569540 RepID=UPI0010AC5A06|nr:hypothetical protein [Desulfosediminicola ganghwensis]